MNKFLVERLAAYAHNAWSGWMAYMLSKGTFNEDGTWTMPKWAVDRWRRQMQAAYSELPENEKESDRAEARQMIKLVAEHLTTADEDAI